MVLCYQELPETTDQVCYSGAGDLRRNLALGNFVHAGSEPSRWQRVGQRVHTAPAQRVGGGMGEP